jgi:hypothetical protein
MAGPELSAYAKSKGGRSSELGIKTGFKASGRGAPSLKNAVPMVDYPQTSFPRGQCDYCIFGMRMFLTANTYNVGA